MFDYLADDVAGYTELALKYRDIEQVISPAILLDNAIEDCTDAPVLGKNKDDDERCRALEQAVCRQLGWCAQHFSGELYFRTDRSVHCRRCDGGLIDAVPRTAEFMAVVMGDPR